MKIPAAIILSCLLINSELTYGQDPVFTNPDLEPYDVSEFTFFRSLTVPFPFNQRMSFAFKPDGTKLFILLARERQIIEYELATAYDITSATYLGETEAFSVVDQSIEPEDIAFNANGTKMFILGHMEQEIFEYTLTTAYDVSTATYAGDLESFSIGFTLMSTSGVTFSTDGMKMFVTDAVRNFIIEYNLSAPFDISTAVDAGLSEALYVFEQTKDPYDITFSPSGTKMFIVHPHTIMEYDLQDPFDISTATYNGFSEELPISKQNFTPLELIFHPEGRKMFVITGSVRETVLEYELSEEIDYEEGNTVLIKDVTANDGAGGADDSSVTYSLDGSDASFFDIDASGVLRFVDVPDFEDAKDFNQDNQYQVFVNATSSGGVTQIPLLVNVTNADDTPVFSSAGQGFDVSTALYSGFSETFFVGAEEFGVVDLTFNANGTKMYVIGRDDESVVEYDLQTPYDASTAIYAGIEEEYSVSLQTRTPIGVDFGLEGRKMFILSSFPVEVIEYNLTTAYDVSTATYVTSASVQNAENGSPIGMTFSSEGTKMFVIGSPGENIATFNLTTGFDLSTVLDRAEVVTLPERANDVVFNTDGTKMFGTYANSDIIYEYNLTAPFDLSTAIYAGDSEAYTSIEIAGNPSASAFNFSGTKMFVEAENRIFEYRLASVVEYLVDDGGDVLNIDANDGMGGANDVSVTYNLDGVDASLFSIDASGVITFNSPPSISSPIDVDMDNIYEFTVNVSNSSETILQSVVVNVVDFPVITSPASVSVDENTTGIIYEAEADSPVTFSLSNTNDASLFTLNVNSLSFNVGPDFENPLDGNLDNRYVVDLIAKNEFDNTASKQVTIFVRNVDEGGEVNIAPVFLSGNAASQLENTPTSEIVLDVNANNGDGGADDENITYSISGTDATAFTIDSNNGEIRFTTVPDFENPLDDGGNNVYNITVTADDGEVTNNIVSQNITITVTDVDESILNTTPVFSSSGSTSIAENTPIATIVLDVDATDGNGGGADENVSYTISGVDAAVFAIDSDDGEIRFRTIPDFENPMDVGANNIYNVSVTADNGALSNNTAVQQIVITVTDVEPEENLPPVFNIIAPVSIPENTPVNTVILDVDAADGDGGAVDEHITYALAGVDATDFAIDNGSGEIRFIELPNFENPQDEGLDNVYNIIVTADDGEQTNNITTQEVTITVTDVEPEENTAPQFISPPSISLEENTPISTVVLDVDATDGDGGAIDENVNYMLSGLDVVNFTIDSLKGEVRFVNIPDFENPVDDGNDNIYNLTIIADDGQAINNIAIQQISVFVTDEDEDDEIVSIETFENNNNLIVYGRQPELTIKYASDAQEQIIIYGMDGQVAFQAEVRFTQNKAMIQPNLLAGRIYILHINDQVVKFMMQ